MVPAGVSIHFGSGCGGSGFAVKVDGVSMSKEDAQAAGIIRFCERTEKERSSFVTMWEREVEVLLPCILECYEWVSPGCDRAWEIDRTEGWLERENACKEEAAKRAKEYADYWAWRNDPSLPAPKNLRG
jgi:hypothetical protein